MNFYRGGDPEALYNYIQSQWDNDWEAALAYEPTPHDIDELAQIAKEYAQRHFINTTVVEVVYNHSFVSLIYSGNGNFSREPVLNFLATDDTGREAQVTIALESRTVMSISTMHNDIQRMEFSTIDLDTEDFNSEMIYIRTPGSSNAIGTVRTRIVEGSGTVDRGITVIHGTRSGHFIIEGAEYVSDYDAGYDAAYDAE